MGEQATFLGSDGTPTVPSTRGNPAQYLANLSG